MKQTRTISPANAEITSEGVDYGTMLEDFGFYQSAFRDGQWEATKKKLADLIEKFRQSPDVAVRTAVALCAPNVAKKRFRSDNLGQTPTTAGKIGGGYEAIDHENGFFSILNIEIFAEVPAGAKRNKERIGEEWMDKAIAKNRLRRREGFMPPVHIWHSDETAVKPTYAGKFILKHRGTITYEGREIPAIFADITDIPADIFKRIQSGTLPYRSVEVHDWENAEIDSLALMDTDVPFFRMAMTTIGNVRKQRGPLPVSLKDSMIAGFKHVMRTPLHWYAAVDRNEAEGAMICFRFEDRKGGANMATDISTTKPGQTSKSALVTNVKGTGAKKTTDLTGQSSGSSGEFGPTSGTNTEDQPSVTGLDDGGGDDGGGDTSGDSGGDDSLMDDGIAGSKRQPGGSGFPKMDDGDGGVDGVESNTAPGGRKGPQVKMDDGMGGGAPNPMAQLAQLCQQMLQICQQAAQPSTPPPSPSADLAPVSGMRAQRALAGGNLSAARIEQIVLKAVTPLQAELARQKKINATNAFKAKVTSMVDAAKEQLTGWPIDEATEQNLFKAAQHGQEFLDMLVETIQKTQPVDPMESPALFEESLADSPDGGDVAKFLAENPGPKANEFVRAQAKDHAAWVQKTGSTITFKEWLAANKYGETIQLQATTRNGTPVAMRG